ncbi:MAG: hypothetical protein KAI83_06355 [Thiomargarita sp.]|nr:hypothetical protein [Thiomargarita sp.]
MSNCTQGNHKGLPLHQKIFVTQFINIVVVQVGWAKCFFAHRIGAI